MKIKVEWDTTDEDFEVERTPEECGLPEEVEIPDEIIADYLSDEYGFLVQNFEIVN
jgi:hypothetical protein